MTLISGIVEPDPPDATGVSGESNFDPVENLLLSTLLTLESLLPSGETSLEMLGDTARELDREPNLELALEVAREAAGVAFGDDMFGVMGKRSRVISMILK